MSSHEETFKETWHSSPKGERVSSGLRAVFNELPSDQLSADLESAGLSNSDAVSVASTLIASGYRKIPKE